MATADPIPFYLAAQTFEPEYPIARLSEHPSNYNQGDVEALADSLDAHGFYGAVIAQLSTGRIVAGNHRYRVATSKGAATLPTFLLDIDDDEAERMLAHDNRTSALAVPDEDRLISLLTGIKERTGSTRGTGYDEGALKLLLRHQASLKVTAGDPTDEWDGMPDFEQKDAKPAFSITMHFPTDADADRFFLELLGLSERPRTRYLWWPEHDGFKGWDTATVHVLDDDRDAPEDFGDDAQ